MNHRPFEDWLLDDQVLTSEQQHELQSHLRVCTSCTAIAESNLALHSKRLISPAPGFAERFQLRLARQRREQRWRQVIGTFVLVLAGLGILLWVAGPVVQQVLISPAEWITNTIGYFLFVLTSIQVVSEVSLVLLRVLPDFVSPFGWFLIAMMLSLIGMFFSVSLWRVTRVPQGV